MPKSKEAFIALLRIFCKYVDRTASEKKAKKLYTQLSLKQWNVFQTNHHLVYMCLEETANESWGLDLHCVLVEYALTTKDAPNKFSYQLTDLFVVCYDPNLTSTMVDLDGQLEQPPSAISGVLMSFFFFFYLFV